MSGSSDAQDKQRQPGTEILYDYDKGKYFRFDQRNGDNKECDIQGHPIPRFYQDFSGTATTADRKDMGRMDDISERIKEDLPGWVGIPTKYVGYSLVPRPGIKLSVKPGECAYTLPKFLEPKPPTLGRISVRAKAAKPTPTLSTRQKTKPSFLSSLNSQYAPSLSMNRYLNSTFPGMATMEDVVATKARNKQKVEDEGVDMMAELRKFRMTTRNKFGSRRPPFTSEDIKNIEKDRFKVVNPKKWQAEKEEYLADKAAVEKRRRDRYIQHFKGKEEEEG